MPLSMSKEVGDGLAGDVGGDMAHQAGDGCPLCVTVLMPGIQNMPLHTLTEIGSGSDLIKDWLSWLDGKIIKLKAF